MRRPLLGMSSMVLAAAAMACWLLSYSWLLGGVIPMDGLAEFAISPWLLAELTAIPLGLAAVLFAALAHLGRAAPRQGRVVAAGWAGGMAALLSLLSVTA